MTLSPVLAQRVGPLVVTDDDWELCRQITAEHSKSFYLSSLILPRQKRLRSWALYAFCRRADDAVDEAPEDALEARVAGLRQGLKRVYDQGELRDGVDRAFAHVAVTTGLPASVPGALIDGMQMDADHTRYHTWHDLILYCFRVASVVGLMMVAALGHNAPADKRRAVLLRASDLGVGMQLTNIARDVGEDARNGRVYLPDALLEAHGTHRDEILALARAGHPPTEGIKRAVAQLLAAADAHYRAADRGIGALPWQCRWAIRSARLIYAAIGERIAQRGYDSLTGRAFVSRSQKLRLAARALIPPKTGPLDAPGPEDAHLGELIDALDIPPDPG